MRIVMVHFHKTRLPPIHYKSQTRTENRQTKKKQPKKTCFPSKGLNKTNKIQIFACKDVIFGGRISKTTHSH